MLQLLRLLCVSFSCAPRASCQQSSDAEVGANAGYRRGCGNCSCCFGLCSRTKVKKKEKCEQFFHFFRPDSSKFLQLFLSLGQVGFPPPVHREVTSSAQSGKAGGRGWFWRAGCSQGTNLDFRSAQASLRFNIFNIPKNSFSFFLQYLLNFMKICLWADADPEVGFTADSKSTHSFGRSTARRQISSRSAELCWYQTRQHTRTWTQVSLLVQMIDRPEI